MLEEVIRGASRSCLNRAPTLHRLGIQSFEADTGRGAATSYRSCIQLAMHCYRVQRRLRRRPDGCARAAVDGGPRPEARFLIAGRAQHTQGPPTASRVYRRRRTWCWAVYCLTMMPPRRQGRGHDIHRYQRGQDGQRVRRAVAAGQGQDRNVSKVINGVEYQRLVETSLGRVIFNEPIPQDMGVQKRDPNDIDSMFRWRSTGS